MATDLSVLTTLADRTVVLDDSSCRVDKESSLLQRLITLLFASGSFRDTDSGSASDTLFLLDFLNGANIMTEETADSILALICSQAMQRLDDEDRNSVDSFTGHWDDGTILFTLKLRDGTTLTGVLNA